MSKKKETPETETEVKEPVKEVVQEEKKPVVAKAPAKPTKPRQPEAAGPFVLEGENGFSAAAPGRGQTTVYDKRSGLMAAILPSPAEARAWANQRNVNEAEATAQKAPRLP